jgi:hypothetical protein
MDTSMMQGTGKSRNGESGFSIMEVMISMVVLMVGLVSLLGVFGLALVSTQTSQMDMTAKQLANEAYETIITARNSTQINWDQIQNVGATNCPISGASTCGIFLTGAQSIYNAGADGIYGTADDSASGLKQTIHDPGPDGIYGTADDVYVPMTQYQRTIAFTNVDATLRNVTIAIQYTTPQWTAPKTYILNSYISEYQ